MKKTALLILAFTILLPASCRSQSHDIPVGKWEYSILLNGNEIGSAVYSNEISGENYISKIDMNMKTGSVSNSVTQKIEETKNFVPVRLEIRNRIKSGDSDQEEKTVALFKNNIVELESSGEKSSIKLDKPFVIEGNYMMSELVKKRFAESSTVRVNLYDPTIETDDVFPVTVKVIGKKNIVINGREEKLIHLVYSIENVKSIDMYIDSKGISRKSVIQMLNNKMEMVIKK